MIAALLALLIEVAGSEPAFAAPGEDGVAAIERIGSVRAVLVESVVEVARLERLARAAARHGGGVIIFGPEAEARHIAELSGNHRAAWLIVPPELHHISAAIAAASGTRRKPERQQSARMAVVADGTAIFTDDAGRRWMVYDRRSGVDRRNRDAEDRVFIAEDGEVRQLLVDRGEVPNRTAVALGDQLRRAEALTR